MHYDSIPLSHASHHNASHHFDQRLSQFHLTPSEAHPPSGPHIISSKIKSLQSQTKMLWISQRSYWLLQLLTEEFMATGHGPLWPEYLEPIGSAWAPYTVQSAHTTPILASHYSPNQRRPARNNCFQTRIYIRSYLRHPCEPTSIKMCRLRLRSGALKSKTTTTPKTSLYGPRHVHLLPLVEKKRERDVLVFADDRENRVFRVNFFVNQTKSSLTWRFLWGVDAG